MMRRVALLAAMFAGFVLVPGCQGVEETNADTNTGENSTNNEASEPGLVAVIDFNEIVTGVGKQEEVNRRLERLAEQYEEPIRELQDQMRSLAEELEGQPLEGNEERFQQYRETRERLQAVAAERQQRLTATRQQLYNEFGENIRPIARRIARQRGMSVVLSSAVAFHYSPDVDITDQVLDELLELMKAGRGQDFLPETVSDPIQD